MQKTNGKVLTEKEYEEVVMDVTLDMDDCYSVEEVDHGAYEEVLSEEPTEGTEFINMMEDVAKELSETPNEEVKEAVTKGKDLGELIGEILSKYPNALRSSMKKKQWKNDLNTLVW